MDHPEILTAYTREEAIAHGLLVDVTSTAAGAGFTVPVAVTWGAWSASVEWNPAGRLQDTLASKPDRLQRLLAQLMGTITRSVTCRSTLEFAATPDGLNFDFEPGGSHGAGRPVTVSLRAAFALASDGNAAITIMLPDEF